MNKTTHQSTSADEVNKATTPAKRKTKVGSRANGTDEATKAKADAEFAARLKEMGPDIDRATRQEEERRKAELEARKAGLDAEVDRLAGLTVDDYELERKETAKEFEVRREHLDERVEHARGHRRAREYGIIASKIEPWEKPIEDAAALFNKMVAICERYFYLPPCAAYGMVLWAAHCHVLAATNHTPRLAFTSPIFGCGKTNCLKLLKLWVPNGMLPVSITPAAVYRVITNERPTLLLDELDGKLKDNRELRTVFNGGHTRNEVVIVNRKTANDWQPVQFDVFGPIAFAQIGKLPPNSSASRCIHIEMARLPPDQDREPFNEAKAQALHGNLGRKLARWAADHLEDLCQAEPDMTGLKGRNRDHWRILYAIADAVDGDWPARVREAAKALVVREEQQDLKLLLLADLRTIFAAHGMLNLTSELICAELAKMNDRPWPEMPRTNRAISQAGLARLLAEFNVGISRDRIPDYDNPNTKKRGYKVAQFEDLWRTYLKD